MSELESWADHARRTAYVGVCATVSDEEATFTIRITTQAQGKDIEGPAHCKYSTDDPDTGSSAFMFDRTVTF
jgi:hypothetical protein